MSMPSVPANFRASAFAGVAEDYIRYRLPYPKTLLEDLLARAAIPEAARLLDLGCGTGRLTLAIANRFAEVHAVDPEPEMIEAGRAAAARLGVSNVVWSTGRAEEFEAPTGHFDLVTAGEAFHRLERPQVTRLALAWLKPGGALAVLGVAGFMDGDAPWRRLLANVVRDFVGEPARRLGAANAPLSKEIADDEAVLRNGGFAEVASFDFHVYHEWALAELLAHHPAGRYVESVRFGYTIARKG
jgi:trans-aconitate methyltransferase